MDLGLDKELMQISAQQLCPGSGGAPGMEELVGLPGEAELSRSLGGGVGMGWKKRIGFLFPSKGIPGRRNNMYKSREV